LPLKTALGSQGGLMEYSLFADESGTSAVDKCFTIGCLLVPNNFLDDFEQQVRHLLKKLTYLMKESLNGQVLKKTMEWLTFLLI
jgi:hypothetical protein